MPIRIRNAEELGALIRRERKQQKLRQQDVAHLIGASHVFLRDVEHGKPTVQLGRVLALLEELGIEVLLDLPEARESGERPA